MAGPYDFYNSVYSTAISLGANDVQARLAAAQASEETGFGKSMVGNNLFGIKASSTYAGPSVTAATNEEYNGTLSRENANFRAYDDFTNSVKDYLGVIQSNFPDAWNAPTFSEAVQGLNTGVYGKYATNSDYATNISSIDKKYGALQYAQNPENVPVPFGPNDQPPDYAAANDVLPVAEPNFAPVDPNAASYDFAMNPTDVPVPGIQSGIKPSAFQEQATPSASPFDAVMATERTPGEWGVRNGVVASYLPTVNTWADIANAPPVSSPMGSVNAEGLLGGVPGFDAQARATPVMDVPATAELGANQALAAAARVSPVSPSPATAQPISQTDVDRAFFNPTGQGQLDPSFTAGLMGPSNPVVPSAVETMSYTPPQGVDIAMSRFSTPAKTNRIGTQELADLGRMSPTAGLIDPSTNTQSFMGAPQPVNVDARGLLATTPGFDATTTASIAAAPTITTPAMQTPNFAQAMMPSIPSMNTFGAQPNVSAPMSSIATPQQQAAGYKQAADSMVQAGMLNIGQQPPTDLSGNLPTNFDALGAAPPLETVSVPEQPTIAAQPATVDGPTTTPAVDQQQTQAVTKAATPPTQSKGLFNGMINKGTIGGGVLGTLAGGPLGGVLGALVGHQLAKGGVTNPLGGLSNSFGGLNSISAPTNQIAGGAVNIGGIYGGAFSPGTYAVANNGATVTAQPNGYTSYTNQYGVSELVSPTGQISHNFGSLGDLFGGSDTPTSDVDPNATI